MVQGWDVLSPLVEHWVDHTGNPILRGGVWDDMVIHEDGRVWMLHDVYAMNDEFDRIKLAKKMGIHKAIYKGVL